MIELLLEEKPSVPMFLFVLILVLLGGAVARCVYDLYFHPLRNFPGPTLAAIGSLYEFYFDVIKGGLYLWEIERMHQKYGPIVRINSKSLHIHDPEYFSTIYAGSGRRIDKEPSAIAGYTFPKASITTIDHDLHRRRRAVVSPYFSKRAVVDLEPMIHERLNLLSARLISMAADAPTVELTSAFSAFTADVVTSHFYGTNPDYLRSRDFSFGLKEALTSLLKLYHWTRFLPIDPAQLKKLPSNLLSLIDRDLPLVINARNANKEKILRIMNDRKGAGSQFKSVIIGALTDPSIPAAEKALDRLLDEGETIIFAGIDTTARTLAIAMFHLLDNPALLQKLRSVLSSVDRPTDKPWTTAELENIPFMRGVIQEALRMSYGLVVRIPRISTEEALQFQQYTIPPGTPVSQSTYLMNNDPSIFPNPQVFDPDRWVRAAQDGVNLDKYMVSFSKGSRGCLGINLAYAMLYLGVARVASSVDMSLETTRDHIEVYHTYAFGFSREKSCSVKVRLTGPAAPALPRSSAISISARLEQV